MTERMMNMPESMHVVTIHNCFEDGQYFYTLLEACNGGDLFDFFRMLMCCSLPRSAGCAAPVAGTFFRTKSSEFFSRVSAQSRQFSREA